MPLGSVKVDKSASLDVSPVDYGDFGVVVASFSEAQARRTVSLQRRTASGWQPVASGEQDADGAVEFRVPFTKGTYRAVATEFSDGGMTVEPVSTPSVSAADQWRVSFNENFSGSRLNSRYWSVRFPGLYYASRMCSASQVSMVKVRDGRLVASVDEVSGSRARTVRANAARAGGVKTSKACPDGVYDNGMVSTEGRYSFQYGLVAARVKFPASAGQHASVWLQSIGGRGSEVDFIETFGLGWEFQHKIHYKNSAGKARQAGGYVKTVPEVKTAAWWDEYHVVSVEWTPKAYIFRVDGVETFRTSKGASDARKFLIISLLTSDWELSRMDVDKLPTSTSVDWVRVWQER